MRRQARLVVNMTLKTGLNFEVILFLRLLDRENVVWLLVRRDLMLMLI